MILEKFFTNEYDNDEIFVEKNVKFSEFKDYVFYQKNEFEKSQIADVVLLCENYFDFAVNFFAAIFAKKKKLCILCTARGRPAEKPLFPQI